MIEIIGDSTTDLESGNSKLEENFFKIKNNFYNDEVSLKIIEIITNNNLSIDSLEIFLSLFDEMLQNSIDAESLKVRIRLKYDKKNNDLIFSIGDNGKGIKGKDTIDKKDTNLFGGSGIGIENLKIISGGNFKLIRNKNGAVASVKINLLEFKKNILIHSFYKQYTSGIINKDAYENNIKIINSMFK